MRSSVRPSETNLREVADDRRGIVAAAGFATVLGIASADRRREDDARHRDHDRHAGKPNANPAANRQRRRRTGRG